MNDLSRRIAGLPPEKRKLLEQLLQREGLNIPVDPGESLREDHGQDRNPDPEQILVGGNRVEAGAGPVSPKGNGKEQPGPWPPSLQRRGTSDHAPLSYAQHRLWFLDQLVPGNPFYNKSAAFHLTFPLDAQVLERSLNEIVRRHEALRTTFQEVDGQPVQAIAPMLTLPLSVTDLSRLPPEERQAQALRLAGEEAVRPFDLAQGSLVRASLLRLAAREHVLLLSMHHIVCDGWSLGVMLRELSALYEAYLSGRSCPLPELPIQYADYAILQRAWLQGDVLDRLLAYWKRQLANLPTLQFPLDRPRPPVQTFQGAVFEITFPDQLVRALQHLSRQEGVTLFMTLLAAFDVLLYRYSGQDDIVVGTYVANRNRAELESLIGFFVNTLVLRTDLSGNPTFRVLLGRVRDVALGAIAHQELPFEKLVEELLPERDLSRNPLFQVVFQLEQVSDQPPASADHGGSIWSTETGTAMFDLAFNLVASRRGLNGRIEYSTDLFDPATIERMARHYLLLLEGIVAGPDDRISNLPLLADAERRALLVEWNITETSRAPQSCVHQLFEEQVRVTPDAVAVVFDQASLTYAGLNQRADNVARHLRRLGVGPEVCVGLYVTRSIEIVIGLLGILKAGGAYVPLDPTYPQDRLAYMLEDSGAQVLLSQQRVAQYLPAHQAQVVYLEEVLVSGPEVQAGQVEAKVHAENLAYVMYTSGSSGKPKGVQVRHCSVVNFLQSMSRRPGLSNQDTFLAVTTLSFDISVLELLLPLSVGACVVVGSQDLASDGERLAQMLATSKATAMQATPATWGILLEAGWNGDGRLKMLCGGEVMPRDLASTLLEQGGSLWNMYGPTETTVWSAVLQVEHGAGPVAIRYPIDRTQIYVLDPWLQPVPVGIHGELYIGGDGLARGYRNRAALTAERFIPDPFASSPGARLYRTGDLVRRRSDGTIEFLGRLDHQVKVRGFRIELGEIEAALTDLPEVKEALVLAPEDVPGEKRLVAYVVPRELPGPSASMLRQLLRVRLPLYMLPSAFVVLDALRRTPNGKIDRRKPLSPAQTKPSLEGEYVAPRSPVEEQLVRLWAEVLRLDRIGVLDDFFELGGHSLLATQLISRVRQLYRVELPLRMIFEQPMVAGMAAFIEKAIGKGERVHQPSIPRLAREQHRVKLAPQGAVEQKR